MKVIKTNVVKTAVITITVAFLSACSFAPGLKVTDTLTTKNVLNSESKTPVFYETKTGVKVRFQNLNVHNIPANQKINSKTIKTIQYLLKEKINNGDYVINKGDLISINLWAYSDLLKSTVSSNSNGSTSAVSYRISQTGKVYLPLIGEVSAAGYTENELRSILSHKYSKYLKYPDLDLKVISFRSKGYSVLGNVNKPYNFGIGNKPVTLMDALGNAGGFTETSDTNKLTLIRNGRKHNFGLNDLLEMGYSTNQIAIKDGDTLLVGSNTNNYLYVFGEVTNKKSVLIPQEGLSLANVIGDSGGLDSNSASSSKVYIVRDNKTITDIYRLDLTQIENFALANRFKMKANDTVYVDSTGLTKFNRVISLLVPSVNTSKSLGLK